MKQRLFLTTALVSLVAALPAAAINMGNVKITSAGATNASSPIVQPTDSTAVTQTLTLSTATQIVEVGLNKNAGGYIDSVSISGFGQSRLEGRNLFEPYCGRGAQASIRDQEHDGLYNPTQAGVDKGDCTPVKIVAVPGGYSVRQFNVPLFMNPTQFDFTQCEDLAPDPYLGDGGNSDDDLLSETCPGQDAELRSGFDLTLEYLDRSAMFGLPALQIDYAWGFMRPSGALLQFDNPAAVEKDGTTPVFVPSRAIQDMSKHLSGNQTTGTNDMSMLTSAWDLRTVPDFTTVMWRSAGIWQSLDATGAFSQKLNCRLKPDDPYYSYVGAGNPRASMPDCAQDNDAVMLSTSTDPDAAFAVAIYYPQTGPDSTLNAKQTWVADATDHKVFQEDRCVQTWARETHMNSSEGDFQKLNVFCTVAGLRSPDALSGGGYETVSRRLFVLFGTPNQIETAITQWRTAGYTGDE